MNEVLFSSQNDIESARQAYDSFLARYPYCYGYWKKYADLEKRQTDLKKAVEVINYYTETFISLRMI